METSSPEETEALAAELAARLVQGDVVTVSGELGSGKTTFVRGACSALGVRERVTSPTYTIGHRYHGVRIGLATARGLGLALDLRGAGVSTLDALSAGAPGALPVIDARRREVFTIAGGVPAVLAPADVEVAVGTVCVGDGAVRYRAV